MLGRPTAGLAAPSLLLVLFLAACSTESPTAVRLVVRTATEVSQVALDAWLDGDQRITGERFDLPHGSPDGDIVLLFADNDAGKTLLLVVEGRLQDKVVAKTTVTAVLRRGETVAVEVILGQVVDGGPWPDIWVPDVGPCEGKQGTWCQGDELITCAGSNKTTRNCPLGCLSQAAPRCKRLVPSNKIPSALLESTVGSLAPTGSVAINTTKGSITGGGKPVVVRVPQPQFAATDIMVFVFRRIEVPKGVELVATGTNALALVAIEDIVMRGKLTAVGSGTTAGPGGGRGADLNTTASGVRPGGNGAYDLINNRSGGGAGGTHGSSGGIGGGGSGAAAIGGKAKLPSTNLDLSPLRGGSGGGRGGRIGTHVSGCRGGGGGGAVQLVAGGTITIGSTGVINVGGVGGGAHNNLVCGGGGGGAGGGILIEAPTVVLEPKAVLAAGGGGGGGGRCMTVPNAQAEAGADGTPDNIPADGGKPGGGGGTGGQGSAGHGSGGKPPGSPGVPVTGCGGGGGGGQGRIRLNSSSGQVNSGQTVLSGHLSKGSVSSE